MRGLVVLAALLLLPGAAASEHTPITSAGRSTLDVEAALGGGQQTVHFTFPFRLLEQRDVYAKVVPAEVPDKPDLNPHLKEPGWRIDVLLDQATIGPLPGHDSLELGRLDANRSYNLALAITIPANRTDEAGVHEFLFSVVAASRSDSNGSGGVLDHSLSMPATIRVVQKQEGSDDTEAAFPTNTILRVLAAVAALIILVFAIAATRRALARKATERRERWAKELSDEELERIRGGDR